MGDHEPKQKNSPPPQEASRRPPPGPEDASKRPAGSPKRPRRGPKETPRGPKTAPKRPQSCLQEAPERPPTRSLPTSKKPLTDNPGSLAGWAEGQPYLFFGAAVPDMCMSLLRASRCDRRPARFRARARIQVDEGVTTTTAAATKGDNNDGDDHSLTNGRRAGFHPLSLLSLLVGPPSLRFLPSPSPSSCVRPVPPPPSLRLLGGPPSSTPPARASVLLVTPSVLPPSFRPAPRARAMSGSLRAARARE